jgi:hypothetical protein
VPEWIASETYLEKGGWIHVTPAKKPEYEVQWDTAGLFRIGQIITGSHYDSVKEDYDIRMKDWAGDGQQTGEGIVHISGGKRHAIKGFLEERRYAITSEYYHYVVRARGKKVDPTSISLKIRELGLKFLWVHVIGGDRSRQVVGEDKDG